ncbi:Uncharacterised protein (plasmid) [Tsukamurella tyrosinosolvens]|uniref:Uncharacterized protein n=1 Tax=Tsukamurella tyrosinosolvens TaxID=57704 RepID=A0A1H4UEP6_TSUTY|nr:hypothetical protein [Tsukamurella tyrosinosolvens]KXO92941.1 hypothetical protein AXK58_13810 [Tsukamurella tyrosinosolvens]SEC67207.1 hypothetical protein SAMN04489793_2876 [Tsukamurella tyrosinosolvens]VEH94173.1 Uncharacterised protein [Tsukamurella tyrosinosolvens]
MNNIDYPHYPHRDTNEGCGHVYPRPDGVRMRCGGWAGCPSCASDAVDAATEWIAAAIPAGAPDEIKAASELLSGAASTLRRQRNSAMGAVAASVAARESGLSPGARGLFQTVPSTWDRHQ